MKSGNGSSNARGARGFAQKVIISSFCPHKEELTHSDPGKDARLVDKIRDPDGPRGLEHGFCVF